MEVFIARVILLFCWLLWNFSGGLDRGCLKTFNDRWPPISDDEFIRPCHKGVDREIALRVRCVVAEQTGIPYERIYPAQNFVNDLGF